MHSGNTTNLSKLYTMNNERMSADDFKQFTVDGAKIFAVALPIIKHNNKHYVLAFKDYRRTSSELSLPGGAVHKNELNRHGSLEDKKPDTQNQPYRAYVESDLEVNANLFNSRIEGTNGVSLLTPEQRKMLAAAALRHTWNWGLKDHTANSALTLQNFLERAMAAHCKIHPISRRTMATQLNKIDVFDDKDPTKSRTEYFLWDLTKLDFTANEIQELQNNTIYRLIPIDNNLERIVETSLTQQQPIAQSPLAIGNARIAVAAGKVLGYNGLKINKNFSLDEKMEPLTQFPLETFLVAEDQKGLDDKELNKTNDEIWESAFQVFDPDDNTLYQIANSRRNDGNIDGDVTASLKGYYRPSNLRIRFREDNGPWQYIVTANAFFSESIKTSISTIWADSKETLPYGMVGKHDIHSNSIPYFQKNFFDSQGIPEHNRQTILNPSSLGFNRRLYDQYKLHLKKELKSVGKSKIHDAGLDAARKFRNMKLRANLTIPDMSDKVIIAELARLALAARKASSENIILDPRLQALESIIDNNGQLNFAALKNYLENAEHIFIPAGRLELMGRLGSQLRSDFEKEGRIVMMNDIEYIQYNRLPIFSQKQVLSAATKAAAEAKQVGSSFFTKLDLTITQHSRSHLADEAKYSNIPRAPYMTPNRITDGIDHAYSPEGFGYNLDYGDAKKMEEIQKQAPKDFQKKNIGFVSSGKEFTVLATLYATKPSNSPEIKAYLARTSLTANEISAAKAFSQHNDNFDGPLKNRIASTLETLAKDNTTALLGLYKPNFCSYPGMRSEQFVWAEVLGLITSKNQARAFVVSEDNVSDHHYPDLPRVIDYMFAGKHDAKMEPPPLFGLAEQEKQALLNLQQVLDIARQNGHPIILQPAIWHQRAMLMAPQKANFILDESSSIHPSFSAVIAKELGHRKREELTLKDANAIFAKLEKLFGKDMLAAAISDSEFVKRLSTYMQPLTLNEDDVTMLNRPPYSRPNKDPQSGYSIDPEAHNQVRVFNEEALDLADKTSPAGKRPKEPAVQGHFVSSAAFWAEHARRRALSQVAQSRVAEAPSPHLLVVAPKPK